MSDGVFDVERLNDMKVFAEIVARTGRVYAHPKTVAEIQSKLGAAEPRVGIEIGSFGEIQMVGISTMEVGVLMAFDPPQDPSQDPSKPRFTFPPLRFL